MKTTKNTAICKVRYQGYDWRNELTITSPTGRSVTIYCNGKWNLMTQEFKNIFLQLHDNNISWGKTMELELSYAVMGEALILANMQEKKIYSV